MRSTCSIRARNPIVDERYGPGSQYLEGATYTGRTVTFGVNASF
jgi:hypothetical protein